jgi:hypothetical protein
VRGFGGVGGDAVGDVGILDGGDRETKSADLGGLRRTRFWPKKTEDVERARCTASGARQPRDSLALPQQHGVIVIVSAKGSIEGEEIK